MPENITPGFCDLHIHSIYSDSDQPLKEIFEAAKNFRLRAISVTDHDSVDGIEPALQLSRDSGIELIPGIELSAEQSGEEIHLLGYFIDCHSPLLIQALVGIKDLRSRRLEAMADKLIGLGLNVNKDELFSYIGKAQPTRLHLAMHMVKNKIACDLRDAFRRFLSPGKPGYVARFKFSVSEAARLIKDCGGLVFMAHPHLVSSPAQVISSLDCGIDGMELVYPNIPAFKLDNFRNLAARRGLLICGGSDAHGSYKEFTKVGGVRVPYEYVQRMKERLKIP
jgi:3',5'-nucleoside bisphosphate phosphatase